MPLSSLGWARRALSAVVCLSALALVMAKTSAAASGADRVGLVAAFLFVVSLIALVEVARREHVEAEHASTDREHQQLALLRLQVELAKDKARLAAAEASTEKDPS